MFMQNTEEIYDSCNIEAVKAVEFVVQIGAETFYIFTPKPTDLFITCSPTAKHNGHKLLSPTKRRYRIENYVEVTLGALCRGAIDQHTFSTGRDLTLNYDVKLEAINLNIQDLFEDVTIDEEAILQIIDEKASEKSRPTVADIRKEYHIRKLSHDHGTSKLMIWSNQAHLGQILGQIRT